MGRVVTNDITAIQPELWSTMVDVPLRKRLVAMEVANTRFESELRNGDTLHIPRFTELSAQTYTPGTPLSATDQNWAYDTIVVTAYKHASFYVDDPRKLTLNIDQAAKLAGSAAYVLGNVIDKHVFANITGADGFTSYQADAGLQGGTAHRPVSAGTAAVISTFANARKVLRKNNVEEDGTWCAVVTPGFAAAIEIKAANAGFNTADATLRNGYAGTFMGFEVYVSNNLPSGSCSTIASTISGGAVSATTCRSMYFGKKGMIDLVMLKAPTLIVRPCEDKIGNNYITYTVYGSGVTTNNRSRGLNVAGDNSLI